ncbi:inorganic phosphate transporter, partial [Citrobacter freundii]|uniref:inorganic phosphate transporter n=1 Tax=Citrobacter freundii TaxID=546 RepID=UPI0039794D74
MLHLFAGLDLHTGLLLLLALAFVLFYEAINGFHDTANAVATVIYTRAMRSQLAVVMAAVFNFFGVLLGGLSVAYAIVGTVAKLAMRQPFVLFKGLTFQKLCLPGAFRPGDHHNKMLRPGLCVVHA